MARPKFPKVAVLMKVPLKKLVRTFPVHSHAVRFELIKDDVCPECGSSLDSNLDCDNMECGFEGVKELQTSPTFEKFMGTVE